LTFSPYHAVKKDKSTVNNNNSTKIFITKDVTSMSDENKKKAGSLDKKMGLFYFKTHPHSVNINILESEYEYSQTQAG